MVDDSVQPSGAEEYVAIEIELTTPLDPEQERELRKALGGLGSRAFDSCQIDAGKISISHDPTRVSNQELVRMVERVGGRPGKVTSAGSPLADLLDSQSGNGVAGEAKPA
jgi:hypothetical protein